ncbi:MAG: RluA family pseudouridine synthase [Chitinophagaceae bacterium]|nr:RluA family pseudouridine synthase [Chitinophagaceae bacterium]
MNILYQDNHLIIIDKPAGISTEVIAAENIKWLMVHRLDQRVSGLIVFAKTTLCLSLLNQMFSNGLVQKKYKAVVAQAPKVQETTLTHWLVKNSEQQKTKAFLKEFAHGKKAVLNYKIIQSSNKYTLLDIHLSTGRFHQIRAQLSAIGSPIVGDVKYGFKRTTPDSSIFLQSYHLSFIHPITKENIANVIDVPELWKKYGF